ncbi:signal peptidase I [Kineococcus gynurae]|uniref:Signal peptidase I n=1 Tax=Kineococcus gynurae TaxID=452979 RepID=A0ABV5LWX4_9ACTN
MSATATPAPRPTPPPERPARHRAARTRPDRRVLVGMLVFLVLVGVLRWQVLGATRVSGTSMNPTYPDGTALLVDETGWRAPRTGDVVVFDDPQDGVPTVKRVVATAGQTVAIDDAVLVVDGVVRPEPEIDHRLIDGLYFGPVRVPAGHVFVLGDDRRSSVDSREFGSVPTASVRGRVLLGLPLS